MTQNRPILSPGDGALTLDEPTFDTSAVARPRISVIIPSYNSGTFLSEAVNSALHQVPPPYEVLVQDGGSTDGTIDILRLLGPRVSWVSQPDGGQADALNKALQRASGDVVLLLMADDIVLPGSMAAASAAFAQDPTLGFVYGDWEMIDETGVQMRRYQSSEYSWDRVYSHGCYIFIGSLFVRREALVAIGGYDASLRACMDFDLLLRLDETGGSKHLGMTVGQFRWHSASKSSTLATVFLREELRLRCRYAGGSPRRWLIALWAMARSGLMAATTRLRYSPRWPRHGGGKTL